MCVCVACEEYGIEQSVSIGCKPVHSAPLTSPLRSQYCCSRGGPFLQSEESGGVTRPPLNGVLQGTGYKK